jgi:hypothetical protein
MNMCKSINKTTTQKTLLIGKYVQLQIVIKSYNKMNIVIMKFNIVKNYCIKTLVNAS